MGRYNTEIRGNIMIAHDYVRRIARYAELKAKKRGFMLRLEGLLSVFDKQYVFHFSAYLHFKVNKILHLSFFL